MVGRRPTANDCLQRAVAGCLPPRRLASLEALGWRPSSRPCARYLQRLYYSLIGGGRAADQNDILSCRLARNFRLENRKGDIVMVAKRFQFRRLARRSVALALLLATLFAIQAFGSDDYEDDYDSLEAGFPLRIAAYVLHPVGVILDTLIFRPAQWLGSKEPVKTLVGNTDE